MLENLSVFVKLWNTVPKPVSVCFLLATPVIGNLWFDARMAKRIQWDMEIELQRKWAQSRIDEVESRAAWVVEKLKEIEKKKEGASQKEPLA